MSEERAIYRWDSPLAGSVGQVFAWEGDRPFECELICLGCGKRPQAPFYDQCFGCGKTGYEQARGWVEKAPKGSIKYD